MFNTNMYLTIRKMFSNLIKSLFFTFALGKKLKFNRAYFLSPNRTIFWNLDFKILSKTQRATEKSLDNVGWIILNLQKLDLSQLKVSLKFSIILVWWPHELRNDLKLKLFRKLGNIRFVWYLAWHGRLDQWYL